MSQYSTEMIDYFKITPKSDEEMRLDFTISTRPQSISVLKNALKARWIYLLRLSGSCVCKDCFIRRDLALVQCTKTALLPENFVEYQSADEGTPDSIDSVRSYQASFSHGKTS